MQPMLILTEEPFTGYMPKDISPQFCDQLSEKQLALLFAHVANKAAGLSCQSDVQDEWLHDALRAWEEVHRQLMERIFTILINEGALSQIPATGKYHALRPFMERNGYCCSSGWWTKSPPAVDQM